MVTPETWAQVMNPTAEAMNSGSTVAWATKNDACAKRPVPNPTVVLYHRRGRRLYLRRWRT